MKSALSFILHFLFGFSALAFFIWAFGLTFEVYDVAKNEVEIWRAYAYSCVQAVAW